MKNILMLVLVAFTGLCLGNTVASEDGAVRLLVSLEGFVPHVYCDVCGTKAKCLGGKDCQKNPAKSKKTIGYGFTDSSLVGKGVISKKEAMRLLLEEVVTLRGFIANHVTTPLTASQVDALVSFVYNIGRTNFVNSEALKLINAGKLDEVPANVKRNWHRGNGVPFKLSKRRNKEFANWNER